MARKIYDKIICYSKLGLDTCVEWHGVYRVKVDRYNL